MRHPEQRTDDFASAALVGLVHRVLAEAGLELPSPVSTTGALLPLTAKRDLLAGIARAHGLRPLLAAGGLLAQMPPDPAVAALLASTGPADLFARWSRLERFVHSRHRVVVCEIGEHHLVAEHVSLTDDPPRAFEDALILGVMAAVLTAIGAVGVTVRLGSDPGSPHVIDRGLTREPDAAWPTSTWRFEWHAVVPPAAEGQNRASDDVATTLRRLVAGDPARTWTVKAAAAALGLSGRSLQRAHTPLGGFAAFVAAVRAERAADLLINADHPLSIVGFACGYADQPHFTREFKRRTAMTPAAYRHAFAKSRSAA